MIIAASAGIVLAGIAVRAALTGRDPFATLGGSGGHGKDATPALALIALGHS